MTGGRAPTPWLDVAVAAALVAAVAAVYGPAVTFDFVNCDDPAYITANDHVKNGLSWDNARWAFTAFEQGNWHPLTWLSHMLDVTLFGLGRPGLHHLTSLLFHAANTILVLLVLKRLSGALWPSAMAAALFALHPQHVESVAWVAERKDVLSAFFGLLALGAYARYAERPSAARYLPVFGLVALGLMAKPMLVTLPFVMLLLDFWPLGRLGLGGPRFVVAQTSGRDEARPSNPGAPLSLRWVLLEKVPLLALVAASSVVTYLAQQGSGAVMGLERCSFGLRLGNAMLSYVMYLWRTLCPRDLALLYAFPFDLSVWQGAAAGAGVAAVTALVVWQVRRRPYLAVGWFWYLGMLVPVIGLVQIGAQARADRYTYLPLVGIFIMAAWGAADLLAFWRRRRLVLVPAAALVLVACALGASGQVAVWANTETLFRHAIASGAQSALAHYSLGDFYRERGDWEKAAGEYKDAAHWNPRFAEAWFNLGDVCLEHGRPAQALEAFDAVIALEPQRAEGHSNRGLALARLGHPAEAVVAMARARDLAPNDPRFRMNLGLALYSTGRLPEAVEEYNNVLRLDPGNTTVHMPMGVALAALGRRGEALEHFRAADASAALPPETLGQMARVLLSAPAATPEAAAEAVRLAEKAAEISGRKDPGPLDTLAAVYAATGQFDKAAAAAGQAAAAADALGRHALADAIRQRLSLYEARRPLPQGPTKP